MCPSRPGRPKTLMCMEPTHAEQCGVTRESSVSIRVVRGLVEVVEHAGVSKSEFLKAARIDAAQLESQDLMVPRSVIYGWCAIAMELTHDPALGLHWAER